MAILHYNNDYVNSPAVDPNAFYVRCVPFRSVCPGSFLWHCLSYLLAFYLLWFHFVSAVRFASLVVVVSVAVVVDSFEDNL